MLDTEATTQDVKDATDAAADAALKASEDFAIMKVGSLDAAGAADAQIASLQGLVSTLDPNSALARQIQRHIDQLKTIPATIHTVVNASFNISGQDEMNLIRDLVNRGRSGTSTKGMSSLSATGSAGSPCSAAATPPSTAWPSMPLPGCCCLREPRTERRWRPR
jgi:hypothetical protein